MMKPTSEQRKGVIGTVVIHLLLLLLFFFLALRTPLPRPGEEGVEIRMGDSYEGTFSENIYAFAVAASRPASSRLSQSSAEEVVTQTDEETVNIQPRRDATPASPPQEQPVVTEHAPATELERKPEPTVDPRALYTGSSGSGNNASGTGTTGNLGRPDGTSSTGGTSGGGYGGTQGSGTGSGGDGQGTRYFLHGRSKISLKEPSYNSNEQGRVVVEVMVDKNGNVVQARAGVRVPDTNIGSTISDQKLWEQAEQAALQSKFSKDEKAAERQKGYIVYNFIKLSD